VPTSQNKVQESNPNNLSHSILNETIDKLPFKRYHIFAFANPRSGDGLASRFLTDFPVRNDKELYFADYR